MEDEVRDRGKTVVVRREREGVEKRKIRFE